MLRLAASVLLCVGMVADVLGQVRWRTPDRFVTPAAGIEQDPPQKSSTDDAQAAKPTPSRIPDPPKDPREPAPPVDDGVAPPVDEGAAALPAIDDDGLANGACEHHAACEAEPCWRPLADRLEVRAEWLLWWGKGNHVPPLVTTGSSASRTQAGVLGQPGTSILFGDGGLNESASSGARFGLDYWLTRDRSLGLEFQYFYLGQNTEDFHADDKSYPVLARPFYNTETSAWDSALIAFPGAQTGNVSVSATSDLQGAEALLRRTWFRRPGARLDFLVGYRYMRLKDDLQIDEFETFIDPAGTVPVGSTLALTDRFNTVNEFQGAELGFVSDWRRGRFDLGLTVKIGLGNTNSRVSIDGNTVATEPTQAPMPFSGGLLAQASNIGEHTQNRFTMLPELGVNLGFDLTRRLRLIGGYSLLYWGGVARSGDQIDINLVPAQFPPQTASGGRFPEFRFATTDYWAQGVNLGLDYRF